MITVGILSACIVVLVVYATGVWFYWWEPFWARTEDAYDDYGTLVDQEYFEKLADDTNDDDIVIIRAHHWRNDFLDNWEAEWNREAIRIRFEELQFHLEIASDFALWQLELEKNGVEYSGQSRNAS